MMGYNAGDIAKLSLRTVAAGISFFMQMRQTPENIFRIYDYIERCQRNDRLYKFEIFLNEIYHTKEQEANINRSCCMLKYGGYCKKNNLHLS